MEERDYFTERDEVKVHQLVCPSCRRANDFKIRWRIRTKKKSLPRQASDADQARFKAARDYMVRVDDAVMCPTPGCRKKIEITALQSVVFL